MCRVDTEVGGSDEHAGADPLLAAVLAHELAHNVLKHRAWFDANGGRKRKAVRMTEREADIAMSPGVRWGPSLIPGDPITREDIWNVTSMSYGEAYRTEMTGEFIKVVLAIAGFGICGWAALQAAVVVLPT